MTVAERLDSGLMTITIAPSQAKIRAILHNAGGVKTETFTEAGESELQLELGKKVAALDARHELEQWVV